MEDFFELEEEEEERGPILSLISLRDIFSFF